ncbi:MAG: flagellar type III secretion system pore protein FliP [Verrucomicrobiota bacterium JB022]|nr:flagellar type III secretion system pore protein FliP [Verrucomicrobiota bacterium JB022]
MKLRWLLLLLWCFLPLLGFAQDNAIGGATGVNLELSLNGQDGVNDVGVGIQIVVLMTLLTLAPTIVLLMTSFVRLVIVLGFVRQAIGTPTAPPNQVIIGLALVLTFFIMSPVWQRINVEAVQPYQDQLITSGEALDIATDEMKGFMLNQTRREDIEFFLGVSQQGPTSVDDLPLTVVAPAFLLSELRTAFQMGVIIFIPFLVIDFVVSSALMALGMMMMPPVMISLPFKILLFVLVDGWTLILQGLVQSYNF